MELTKKIGAVLEGKIRETLSRGLKRGGGRGGLTRNLKHNTEGTCWKWRLKRGNSFKGLEAVERVITEKKAGMRKLSRGLEP